MARSLRDSRLEARTHRLKLEKCELYWLKLDEGLSLIYRRNKEGIGTWSMEQRPVGGKKQRQVIGVADDYQDANGETVLSFAQAQSKALDLNAKPLSSELTVGEAAQTYLTWFKDNRKSYRDTEIAVNAHVLQAFGDKRIAELTQLEIRQWHERLATAPARLRVRQGEAQRYAATPKNADEKRPRKATANRVLTVLKAILNKAFHDGRVHDNAAWRSVKPFRGVDEPVVRFLTVAECTRLVNACDPDFRLLVQAALQTGCRYGELAALKVGDVNIDLGSIFVRVSKGGKSRHVPLSAEGLKFFQGMVAGKLGDDLVFLKENGQPWGRSHQSRPLFEACKRVKITPAVSFHELRHSYASLLAQAGADLLTISKLLGHADTRITSRHYAHLCDKTLANTVRNLLPEFGNVEVPKVTAIR